MKKMITMFLTLQIVFMFMLCMVLAKAEESACFFDDDNHVVGEMVVDGYTFSIDATLEQTLPEANRIHYTAAPFDQELWEVALFSCFPENAEQLSLRLSQDHADVGTMRTHSHVPIPVVLPKSKNMPDEYLVSLQNQCSAFLARLGISHDPIPFSLVYIAPHLTSTTSIAFGESERDVATGADVCFLLAYDDTPVIIGLETQRLRGSLDYTHTDMLSQYPTAQFCFDMEGNLLDFKVANLSMESLGTLSADFISWEEALELTLGEFIKPNVIRQNLAQFSYTVTDIRCVWDIDFSDMGKPGWMISIHGQSSDDASPTGWRNRYTTYFVYGGK